MTDPRLADDPEPAAATAAGGSADGERAGAGEGSGPPDGLAGPGTARQVSLARAVVAAAAVAFLLGSLGYFVGVRTSGPPTSAVDEGFLRDMTDHHDQAVSMALVARSRAQDPTVREFATEVLLFQREELGRFTAYMQERGLAPTEYNPERTTMAWMDMPTPMRTMPGMASEEQIARLDTATGRAFDELFLELMAAHHEGGAHMSTYAAEHAADPDLREMAGVMARNQTVEVREYRQVLERLRAS